MQIRSLERTMEDIDKVSDAGSRPPERNKPLCNVQQPRDWKAHGESDLPYGNDTSHYRKICVVQPHG